MQYAFYYDQTRCIGCQTCMVACKDWNDVKPGPAWWRRQIVKEEGKYPNLSVYNLILSCNHCSNPACLQACPFDAIFKRAEDGIVVIDRAKCQGTRLCLEACPFGAPQFGDDASEPVKDPAWLVAHPAQKCTFCWDRWQQGKKPACVDACPMRALDAGPVDELKQKYPDARWSTAADGVVKGFANSTKDSKGRPLPAGSTYPNIGVKPRR